MLFKLHLRLEMARLRMVDMGMRYGLDDPRVIAQSHVVDRLHMEWERMVASEGYRAGFGFVRKGNAGALAGAADCRRRRAYADAGGEWLGALRYDRGRNAPGRLV